MKKRQYNHDYFNDWRDKYSKKKYIWPQLVYEPRNDYIVGLVFEINDSRDGAIMWPSKQGMALNYSFINLDFRNSIPLNTENLKFFINDISNNVSGIEQLSFNNNINTFEDFARDELSTLNLSCVDIDSLEYGILENEYKYVGIEGTHLKVPIRENNIHSLLESLFLKRFLKQKAHQLNIQKSFMDKLGGSLYLLIYNIKDSKCSNELILHEKGNSVLIEVNSQFLNLIRKYQDSSNDTEKLEILNELITTSVRGLSSFKSNYNILLNLVCKFEI